MCLQNDLTLMSSNLVHFGTEENLKIMTKLIDALENSGVIINCQEEVVSLVDKNDYKLITTNKSETYEAKYVVLAVGRNGNEFVSKWCKENSIEVSNNQVDIGVRVEMPKFVWKHFSDEIYEPKITYRTKKFGDITRMFCFNTGNAHVVAENNGGVVTVNGHAFLMNYLTVDGVNYDSDNCNFALLSTINFTEPFKSPIEYCKHVASLANMLSGGSVLVQRYVDLINGRRTTESRLKQSTVKPTLNAVPGDLSLVIPKRQLDNIIETLEKLNKVAPGCTNQDTLLYGVECKYYSVRPKFSEDFRLDGHDKIFAIGDGAGVTRSLSQAGANGLYVGDIILKEI
jgi:uncharacterized FAD-dependent dehydrogenase